MIWKTFLTHIARKEKKSEVISYLDEIQQIKSYNNEDNCKMSLANLKTADTD